ncbi:hypothetical protein N7G274_009899 [Stereocaulon virgatum]|uniref:Uncharacterized protein n=1 Tax=Stereocaulon virgatum TaxID=373712 RepID=A0ABR3ZY00_9LECA
MSLGPVHRCLRVTLYPQGLRLPLHPLQAADFRVIHHRAYATSTDKLPRIAQPTIWHAIIPKALRNPESSKKVTKPQHSKAWNPATFFICIFLLIGSNGIRMLTLRNEYSITNRKADAKIALLKDVLDKIQRGEQVDVERVLGTGDEEQEQEWTDVIKHIEEEDRLWSEKDRRREQRRLHKEQEAAASASDEDTAPKDTGDPKTETQDSTPVQVKKLPSFL